MASLPHKLTEPLKSVPLTAHGHTRPITHIEFSSQLEDGEYFLISGAKDRTPQLRDGITGDWIGTFIGHEGAVWDARLSKDTKLAATASADFTVKLWSTLTGETLHTLNHGHVMHACAFPPALNPCVVATGGKEKKLRVWDFGNGVTGMNAPPAPGSTTQPGPVRSPHYYDIGKGEHGGPIKHIVWNTDTNVITTACEDRFIRWFDLRTNETIKMFQVDDFPSSLELTLTNSTNVLSVTAGKKVFLFNGAMHGTLSKEIELEHDVVSAAVDTKTSTLLTGAEGDTWVHVWDIILGRETATLKGHHGPVWTIKYSPDGKIIGTGSEDGTIKLWRNSKDPYGLWKN